MVTESRDCVVVGGGPSGSAFAGIVKKYAPQRSVLVLEKEHFPRWHIGESLIPAAHGVLRDLELFEVMKTRIPIKKIGIVFVWGEDREPWNADYLALQGVTGAGGRGDVIDVTGMDVEHILENGTKLDGPMVAFNVRRAVFDDMLLRQAQHFGAEVREGVTVTSVLRDSDQRVCGVTWCDESGREGRVETPFVLDATGGMALLGRGKRVRDPAMNNFAVYGYLSGAEWKVTFSGARDYTTVFVCTIDKGWIWYFPIDHDVMSVGIVTNTDHFRDRLKDIDLEAFFWEHLNSAPELEGLVKSAKLRTDILPDGKRVNASADWSYWSRETVGEGWASAGDAAMFIDPVLSTGLTMALLSGHRAAYTFNTMHARPELEARSLWRSYADYIRGEASSFLAMARYFYGNNRAASSWWWKAQNLVNQGGRLDLKDRQAFIFAAAGFFPVPRAIGPEVIAPLMSHLLGKKNVQDVGNRPPLWSTDEIERGAFESLAPMRLDLQAEPALKGDNRGLLEVYHDLVTDHPDFTQRLLAAPCRIAPSMAPVVSAMNTSQRVRPFLERAPSLLPEGYAPPEAIRKSALDILQVAAIKGYVRIDA